MVMPWYPSFYQLTHDFSALPFHYEKLCQVVKITPSLSGHHCRLKLTNRYGKQDLVFDEIMIADNPAFNDAQTICYLHQRQIIIPQGQVIKTDPVLLMTNSGQPVYVRMVAKRSQEYADFASTYQSDLTNATISRSLTMKPVFSNRWRAQKGWFSLESLEIQTLRSPKYQIEITGDSLVESGMVTAPLIQYFNQHYPDQFVWYQTGISGNQLLHDAPVEEPLYETFGNSLLHRQRLNPISTQITLAIIGTNDLLLPYYSHVIADQNVTPRTLLQGFQQLQNQCATRESRLLTTTIASLRLFDLPTLQPVEELIELQRERINQLLVQQPGVIDGGQLLTNPRTGQLDDRYDFGDHIHWNPAGGQKIAKAFSFLIQKTLALS